MDYIVGIARNARLSALAKPVLAQAREAFDHRGTKQRYVLTNLKGTPQYLYDKVYCARGEMENRIKEQQLDLFADHTRCHRWWPNPYRVLLSTLAYGLLNAIRTRALAGTELARAYDHSNERAEHLPLWLHRYNWHRPHASLKYQPPIHSLNIPLNNVVGLHS